MAADTATVNVVIEAFTQAAQSAVDDVGDELNNLTGDGAIAQAALDEVGDEMNNLTADSLPANQAIDDLGDEMATATFLAWLFQSQVNEVGDELLKTTGKAGAASGGMFSLAVSTEGASMSMRSMSGVIVAALIPALVALGTVLWPLAAALGTVAFAAAGLIGLPLAGLAAGAGTNFEDLKETLTDVKDALLEVVRPLGDLFGPILLSIVAEIPGLVSDMLDAAGSFEELAWFVLELWSVARESLPGFMALLMDLTSDAMDPFLDMVGWFQSNGADLFGAMVDTTKDLGPAFMAFVDALIEASPAINEFGTELLKRILPAMGDFLLLVGDVASKVDWDDVSAMGRELGDALDTVMPALSALVAELIEAWPLISAIGNDVLDVLAPALAQTAEVLTAVVGAFNELDPAHQRALIIGLALAIGALGGPLTALVAAIVAVGAAWPWLEEAATKAISGTRAALDGFVQFMTRDLPQYLIMAFSLMSGAWTAFTMGIVDQFQSMFNALVGMAVSGMESVANRIIDGMNGIIQEMNKLIERANEDVPGFNMDTFGQMDRVSVDSQAFQMDRAFQGVTAQQAGATQAQAIAATLDLDVNGDGPLAQWLSEQATINEDKRAAQQDRYQKRQNVGGAGGAI